eukprot:TRINITY_DN1238_c0_g1_i1.p1 TRINITY_DN1238_c0_g1~~TRINITY_DN1238_c0_g1_i1.p1  ORF type:complete len:269 (+),score=33.09 TRINITY_DN1238_c0_g1_i1:116-808(+)
MCIRDRYQRRVHGNLINPQTKDLNPLELNLGAAPTLDSYTKTSIASFGVEMLKSMGWYEGRGIGKTPQIFTPVEIKPRNHRQGLGADSKFSSQTKKITKEKNRHEKKDTGKKKRLKWVQNGMQLEIISKHYHDGDYLGRKGRVVERLDNYNFVFQLDPPFTSLLYDLKERQVEPIEPKVGQSVCVISREYRGQVGRVIQIKGNLAVVELEDTAEVINIVTKKIATIIDNE